MVYEVKVGGQSKKAHLNQLSKVTFQHRLYDAFDPLFYQFERGQPPTTSRKPPNHTLRRSGRNRRPPVRYQA
jgi:hypothetical protein